MCEHPLSADKFVCQMCSFTVGEKRAMERHLRKDHFNQSFYPCDKCDHVARTKKGLEKHGLHEHNVGFSLECDICLKRFQSEACLNLHKMTHGEKEYRCDQCLFVTHTIQLMKSHKVSRHSMERNWKCDLCNKAFKLNCNLIQHKKNVHSNIQHKCDLCEYSTKSAQAFKSHKITHIRDKVYRCDLCDFTSHRWRSLKYHRSTHEK